MRVQAAEIRRWRHEPWTFARQVLHAEYEPFQDELFHALVGQRVDGTPLEKTYQRFALQACKGPGKSAVDAMVMWWFMVTHPMAKIGAVSITKKNLQDNLWAELAKWQKRSTLLQAAFEWTSDRVYEKKNPENWFMSARAFPVSATPEQQAATLAGFHGDFVMMVLDESGSIPPGVLATADAALANAEEGTGREAFIIQSGNPTETTGALYVAAAVQRPLWWVKEISGNPKDPNRATRVSKKWAQDLIDQHGEEHPYVLINVMGKFPPGGSHNLIPLDKVTDAKDRKLAAPRYHEAPKILGVDVARFGEDETCVCLRQGPLVFPLWGWRGINIMQTTGHVARLIEQHDPDAVFVDSTGGYGSGVVDRLQELNYVVHGIEFAGQAIDAKAYLNKRAEIWDLTRIWLNGEVAIPNDSELISQLPAPKYKYASDGRMQLESKEDIKKRGLPSPDRGDALALTFSMPVPHRRHRQQQRVAQTQYDWRTHGR